MGGPCCTARDKNDSKMSTNSLFAFTGHGMNEVHESFNFIGKFLEQSKEHFCVDNNLQR